MAKIKVNRNFGSSVGRHQLPLQKAGLGLRAAKAPPKPTILPELQETRNCGACGAAKHVFPSQIDETPCDLCGKIQWV